MSYTEVRLGKVKEIIFSYDATMAEKAEHLKKLGYDINQEEFEDNYIDCDDLCMFDGRVFEILEDRDFGDDDIAIATKNIDDTISYTLKYYNGGTCFTEMLQGSIVRMEKKEILKQENTEKMLEQEKTEMWYKDWCPKCDTVNWTLHGDVGSLECAFFDGYRCRKCNHIVCIWDPEDDVDQREMMNPNNPAILQGRETPDLGDKTINIKEEVELLRAEKEKMVENNG